MKFPYCPNCFSANMKQLSGSEYKCNKCSFKGKTDIATLEEINAFTKKANVNRKPLVDYSNPKESTIKNGNELKEKLKSLKGKSSEDFEIF